MPTLELWKERKEIICGGCGRITTLEDWHDDFLLRPEEVTHNCECGYSLAAGATEDCLLCQGLDYDELPEPKEIPERELRRLVEELGKQVRELRQQLKAINENTGREHR